MLITLSSLSFCLHFVGANARYSSLLVIAFLATTLAGSVECDRPSCKSATQTHSQLGLLQVQKSKRQMSSHDYAAALMNSDYAVALLNLSETTGSEVATAVVASSAENESTIATRSMAAHDESSMNATLQLLTTRGVRQMHFEEIKFRTTAELFRSAWEHFIAAKPSFVSSYRAGVCVLVFVLVPIACGLTMGKLQQDPAGSIANTGSDPKESRVRTERGIKTQFEPQAYPARTAGIVNFVAPCDAEVDHFGRRFVKWEG